VGQFEFQRHSSAPDLMRLRSIQVRTRSTSIQYGLMGQELTQM
jgi:hypothetical protein